MSERQLLVERGDRVALVTLNRPDHMNALTPDMVDGLEAAIEEIEDDDAVAVSIVTGAGKAFCAGGDLSTNLPRVTELGLAATIADPSARFFSRATKPIIAAVNGLCLAGGLEIMLGTDVRVAADRAVFGLPEPKWGLFPAGGGSVRLPRQLPWARAMELLLTGDNLTAQEALQLGLVNRVVPVEDVLPAAQELAARMIANGPLAIRKIKEAVLRHHGLGFDDAFAVEFDHAVAVFDSADAKEGPKAFVEKRNPNFTGS